MCCRTDENVSGVDIIKQRCLMDNKIHFCEYKVKLDIPLYKYYKNLDFAIDAIKNHRIHLELPTEYNDIYDSSLEIVEEHLLRSPIVHLDSFCSWIKESSPMYKDLIDDETRILLEKATNIDEGLEIIHLKKNIPKVALISNILFFINNRGPLQPYNNKISCFSEKNDSLLMWAYYANSYQGVCLEFDFKNEPFLSKHIHKVQYSSIRSQNPSGAFHSKSEEWSHEQEWRIVCNLDEEYISTNSLKGIYLGPKIKPEQMLNFILLARTHKLDLYYGKPSKTNFKLNFIKILTNGEKISETSP